MGVNAHKLRVIVAIGVSFLVLMITTFLISIVMLSYSQEPASAEESDVIANSIKVEAVNISEADAVEGDTIEIRGSSDGSADGSIANDVNANANPSDSSGSLNVSGYGVANCPLYPDGGCPYGGTNSECGHRACDYCDGTGHTAENCPNAGNGSSCGTGNANGHHGGSGTNGTNSASTQSHHNYGHGQHHSS